MTTANPIESNPTDMMGVQTMQVTAPVGKFASVFDAAASIAQYSGPAVYASTAQYAPNSAEIVGAAINSTATYGGSSGLATLSGNYSGATTNYYGGGTSALSAGGTLATTNGDDMLGMAQDQLAQSQASSVAMLMVQDQMGTQNRLYTSASNLMNSRDTMLGSIIRNVRVG